MGFRDRLGDSLHEEDLKRFVKKNPSTKKVRLKPGNYGSDNIREKRRADAGTIDYHHYGGKKSKETRWEDLMSGRAFLDKYSKKKGKNNETREDWKKVAKELGIGSVDSEDEVLRMIEYVRGQRAMEKEPEPVSEQPDTGPVFEPTQPLLDTAKELDDMGENPVPRMSDQDGVKDQSNTSNPYLDAITHGDDLNDWYTRDTKRRELEAQLAGMEIGERTRFHANRFDGKVTKALDVGKLYENYADKL
tara:strand:+ start:1962 stop:2702 length:741 start_codon:yes stop_codon:yes gene_type:complete